MPSRSRLAVAVIVGIILVLVSTPVEAVMTESQYLSYMADQTTALGNAATSSSDILQNWINGYVSDATAMSLLEAERSDAQYINNALSSTSPPCTAYSTVHSIIRSASGDIERALYYEIPGIDTYDSSYMTMAVDYANSAPTHMQNAHD